MGTQIKVISGRIELRNYSPITEYEKSNLYIDRFYGGKENGAMIQLTIDTGSDYIQLTKGEAYNLGLTLLRAFDYKAFPSE
jgi:predicted aspartyl protease